MSCNPCYWIIEPPSGIKSRGRCKYCGDVMMFANDPDFGKVGWNHGRYGGRGAQVREAGDVSRMTHYPGLGGRSIGGTR